MRQEVDERSKVLQTLVNGLTTENLEMKSKVARVELENTEIKNELETLRKEDSKTKEKMKTLEVLLTELYDKITKLGSNEN